MEQPDNINYRRIEKAIRYISENFRRQPSLDEIASHVGMSPYHFQRTFTEWAGVSPKKFAGFLTVESLKGELARKSNLNEWAESVGLSSQSRVYDLFVSMEAVTPGEYKSGGKGLSITYGFGGTPFGECFVASTPKGICSMQFADENHDEIISNFISEWPGAAITRDDADAAGRLSVIFGGNSGEAPINIALKGTPFQLKVWRALLEIPFGDITSYSELALLSGNIAAVRATASAVAANPIAYLIPCHRVIRSEGIIGQYRWNPDRKAAMLGWEKAKKSGENE